MPKPSRPARPRCDAAAAPITSRLAGQKRLQPIVRKFADRLHERLVEVQQMESRNDFGEIASFAHWLKGSAGSMGYDAFTAPAMQLETAAKATEVDRVRQLLGELRRMAQRIVVPEETSAAT